MDRISPSEHLDLSGLTGAAWELSPGGVWV